MAKRTNLRKSNIPRDRRRTQAYGTQTPLSSTAVERGSTRWLDGSNVSIEGLLSVSGTATVGGTLSVTGTLNASGAINLSGNTGITGPLNVTGTTTIGGNTNITGELNVTGPTTLDGVLDIGGDTMITGKIDVTGPMATKGTLSVEGVTTLQNDLIVRARGTITAGQVVIDPNSEGGSLSFDSAGITAGTTGFRFTGTGGKSAIVESVGGGSAQLVAGGSTVTARAGAIDLTASAVHLSGALNVAGLTTLNGRVRITNPYATASPPNVYMDESGAIYRTNWKP